MDQNDLIAPENYNIIQEMERFADEQERVALQWENEEGKKKEITYPELLKKANKIGNIFLQSGLKKGDTVLVMIPRLIEAYAVYMAVLKRASL